MFMLNFKKVVLLSFLIITVCFINYITQPILVVKMFYYMNPEKSIYCYRKNKTSLKDISEVNPMKDKSIFFHETSCNSFKSGKIVIEKRQACSVESAAKMNPNYSVYLLFTSPGILKYEGTESDRMLQALLTYKNVNVLHVNYENYTRGTPVENLYKSGKVEYSEFAQSHASDLLRYVTLWKYGGIYLDLDVVVIKSLENLPPNYAGAESEANVAAGIMNFQSAGLGHEYARRCLNDLEHNYKYNDWGYNGPGVITRLLKNLCGEEMAKDMVNKECQGFTVYPPKYFYPIPWQNWTYYFQEQYSDAVLQLSRDSYIIHVWNKHSIDKKIPLMSKIPYATFAQTYCPKVYQECDTFF